MPLSPLSSARLALVPQVVRLVASLFRRNGVSPTTKAVTLRSRFKLIRLLSASGYPGQAIRLKFLRSSSRASSLVSIALFSAATTADLCALRPKLPEPSSLLGLAVVQRSGQYASILGDPDCLSLSAVVSI